MKPLMAIVIGATFGASAAHATPPRVVRYYQPPPVLAFQAVPLPIYHVAYGSAQQADPAILERIAAAQERQAAALEKLASRGPNGELADLPPEPEYVGLVRQNCASCHGINPKGNKYSMFHADGRFREPTDQERGELIFRLSTTDPTLAMPKGHPKFDPAIKLAMIAGFSSRQPEAAAKMPPGK